MNRLLSILMIVWTSSILQAQTRIDSSFAFQTNPAKKYSVYLPTGYNSTIPNKTMIAFHPLNLARWDAKSWCDTLKAFAESNQLLLICPDGGANGDISDQIDYDFTLALIDSANKWYNIDTTSIYAMGFSVGGLATYEFGLNNTSIFGGYIAIGAAINGTSGFTSLLPNSTSEPFYLVHGNNDSPSVRFFPMLTALENNCAITNSILMPGVGHTIDFPSRNQILSTAYDWIDSVNHAPIKVNSGFGLESPITGSSFVIQGFSNKTLKYIWDDSKFAPNCTSYELLIDDLSGNFTTPLLVIPSGNNGKDTSISNTYFQVDSTLNAAGVTVSSTFTFKWAVAATFQNKYRDTTKSFQLSLRRERVGFRLLTPASNANLTLSNNQSIFFDWNDLLGNGIKYELLFDSVGGDFSNPLFSFESLNSGNASTLTLSHEDLFYKVIFDNFNLNNGDTARLIWTARAYDSTYSEFASNVRQLNLRLGDVGMELISPPNNSLTLGRQGVELYFLWDSLPLSGITYNWLIDTTNGTFNNPLTVFSSDNAGKENNLTASFNIIDSVLNVFNILYGDTFEGKWTVQANGLNNTFQALGPFNIKIFRDLPKGIDEPSPFGDVRIYPLPARNELNLEIPENGIRNYSLVLYNETGAVVLVRPNFQNLNPNETLKLEGLKSGNYFLEIREKNSGKSGVYKVIIIKD